MALISNSSLAYARTQRGYSAGVGSAGSAGSCGSTGSTGSTGSCGSTGSTGSTGGLSYTEAAQQFSEAVEREITNVKNKLKNKLRPQLSSLREDACAMINKYIKTNQEQGKQLPSTSFKMSASKTESIPEGQCKVTVSAVAIKEGNGFRTQPTGSLAYSFTIDRSIIESKFMYIFDQVNC